LASIRAASKAKSLAPDAVSAFIDVPSIAMAASRKATGEIIGVLVLQSLADAAEFRNAAVGSVLGEFPEVIFKSRLMLDGRRCADNRGIKMHGFRCGVAVAKGRCGLLGETCDGAIHLRTDYDLRRDRSNRKKA
jgi:hypothetical protein